MRPPLQRGRSANWRLALLALLAIAWSQLAIAEHQFEHDAGVAGDVCAVCLQIEQLDVPHAIVPAVDVGDAPETAVAGRNSIPVVRAAVTPYASRAPPRTD